MTYAFQSSGYACQTCHLLGSYIRLEFFKPYRAVTSQRSAAETQRTFSCALPALEKLQSAWEKKGNTPSQGMNLKRLSYEFETRINDHEEL